MINFDDLKPKDIIFYDNSLNSCKMMFISKNFWSENTYIFIQWDTAIKKGILKTLEKNCYNSLDEFIDNMKLKFSKILEETIKNLKEKYLEKMEEKEDFWINLK